MNPYLFDPRRAAAEIIYAAFAVAAVFYLTSCSAWQGAQRAVTISRLETSACKILGKIAVGELRALASSELGGGDYAHSAAAAAWSSVDAGDLADLINSATDDKAKGLASAASSIAFQALEKGANKQDVFNAVASAISAQAFAK